MLEEVMEPEELNSQGLVGGPAGFGDLAVDLSGCCRQHGPVAAQELAILHLSDLKPWPAFHVLGLS